MVQLSPIDTKIQIATIAWAMHILSKVRMLHVLPAAVDEQDSALQRITPVS